MKVHEKHRLVYAAEQYTEKGVAPTVLRRKNGQLLDCASVDANGNLSIEGVSGLTGYPDLGCWVVVVNSGNVIYMSDRNFREQYEPVSENLKDPAKSGDVAVRVEQVLRYWFLPWPIDQEGRLQGAIENILRVTNVSAPIVDTDSQSDHADTRLDGPVGGAYAKYDGDPRVSGPHDRAAFVDAVGPVIKAADDLFHYRTEMLEAPRDYWQRLGLALDDLDRANPRKVPGPPDPPRVVRPREAG